MHLSGQLSDWSPNDLLHIMQVTKKTGSLDVDGEKVGRIHFNGGNVTGAELAGARGTYRGADRATVADILYVLSTVTSGEFSIGPADGPDGPSWSVEDILSDVEALRSLEGEVVDAGLFEAPAVRLVGEISEPITIEPGDWYALAALVQPFTFNDLEIEVGRGGAVRIFHALHRLGMIEPSEVEEDQSAWLDRLAERIGPVPGVPALVREEGSEPASVDATEPAVPVEEIPALSPSSPAEHPQPIIRGVAAPASTTLTDGVYDEIRRLRSKVTEK